MWAHVFARFPSAKPEETEAKLPLKCYVTA